jgi:hypothetical protein
VCKVLIQFCLIIILYVLKVGTVGDFVSTASNCWFVFICKVPNMSTVYFIVCNLCLFHNTVYNL